MTNTEMTMAMMLSHWSDPDTNTKSPPMATPIEPAQSASQFTAGRHQRFLVLNANNGFQVQVQVPQ